MRFNILIYFIVLLCSQIRSFGQNEELNNASSLQDNTFLSADFLAGALQSTKIEDEDSMGTQRLIDVKNSQLSPSLSASFGYNYSSNPVKVRADSPGYLQDGVTAQMNLSFNLGLGEYGIGDEVLATPSFMLMQMRTYNDPVKDYGKTQNVYDVDVQIVGFSMPFVLPDDFIVTLGHSYVRPVAFRTKNVISYSNTPSLTLAKNFPLPTGDVVTFTAGISYSFTEGDTLKEQISDPVYYDFIAAVMDQSGNGSASSLYPSNLQDSLTHTLNLVYTKPIGDRLTISPSVVYSNSMYTSGSFVGRSDQTYSVGTNASYPIFDWFSVSASANHMWKESSDTSTEFKDFVGGVTFGVNYAF
jgi:hypothetical protein